MFDKKQKPCIKRIHSVTDDGLYDRKAFYKVEIVFIHPLFCFEILDEIQLLETFQKNNCSVPVLKNIKKRNVYEKENLYFKGF